MKLKNKRTSEIGYLRSTNWNETALIIMDKDGVQLGKYSSLAELNEEWEDYEENNDRWYINENGGVLHYVPDDPEGEDLVYNKYQDEIGNYFETKEEAEKAVEKLKAWKRLKDKGFRFNRWQFLDGKKGVWVGGDPVPDIVDELDILFGGEE